MLFFPILFPRRNSIAKKTTRGNIDNQKYNNQLLMTNMQVKG